MFQGTVFGQALGGWHSPAPRGLGETHVNIALVDVPHDRYDFGEAIDLAREADQLEAARDTIGCQPFGNCSKQTSTVLRPFFPKKIPVNHDEMSSNP